MLILAYYILKVISDTISNVSQHHAGKDDIRSGHIVPLSGENNHIKSGNISVISNVYDLF